MYHVHQEVFQQMVAEAIDNIPKKYQARLDNVAFLVEDQPTPAQREKLRLRAHQSLYGLYEGVPLVRRGGNSNLLLPDKITLFKEPLEANSFSLADLRENIRHTLWHEVAHYYGLDHDRIHELERPPEPPIK